MIWYESKRQIFQVDIQLSFGRPKKKIFDLLINCWFLFVLTISDANHLSVKVRKAAIPDVWDLGVLIHDFFITDVTREDF